MPKFLVIRLMKSFLMIGSAAIFCSTLPIIARADLSKDYRDGSHYVEYSSSHPRRIYATRSGHVYMIDPAACGGGWHGKIGVISADSGYTHPGYCSRESVTNSSSFITTIKPLKLDWSEIEIYKCASDTPFSEICISPITKTVLRSITKK